MSGHGVIDIRKAGPLRHGQYGGMTAAPSLDGRTFDGSTDTECIATVSQRLLIEYGDDLPEATVRTVVMDASSDLAGQIPATALAEMLERLVRYRLDRLIAAAQRA